MSHRLVSLFSIACLAVAVAACQETATEPALDGPATVLAAAASPQATQVFKDPVAVFVGIPCLGEVAQLEGVMHSSFHTSADANGGFHAKAMFNPSGLTGTTPSGLVYNGTGNTQEHLNLTAGVTQTFVNNFRMIGRAGAPSLRIHQVFHITINANGDITALVDNVSATCD